MSSHCESLVDTNCCSTLKSLKSKTQSIEC